MTMTPDKGLTRSIMSSDREFSMVGVTSLSFELKFTFNIDILLHTLSNAKICNYM